MPLSTTDAAAVEGFLRSRRGTRELRDHVVTSLLTSHPVHGSPHAVFSWSTVLLWYDVCAAGVLPALMYACVALCEGHGGTAARASIPVRVVTLHGARRVRSGPVLVWEPPGYSIFESELSLSPRALPGCIRWRLLVKPEGI